MARCPAHGNRIQLNPSRAVNLFGATPQPDCRRTLANEPTVVNGAEALKHIRPWVVFGLDPKTASAYDIGSIFRRLIQRKPL